jgi:hypothetical protein
MKRSATNFDAPHFLKVSLPRPSSPASEDRMKFFRRTTAVRHRLASREDALAQNGQDAHRQFGGTSNIDMSSCDSSECVRRLLR